MAGGFWRKVAGAFVEFDPADPRTSDHGDDDVEMGATVESTEAMLKDLGVGTKATPKSAPKAAAPKAPDGPAVAPGLPFADLYARAKLPATAHPAEKMLLVLNGLAALPPEAARQAIRAMDEADDAWSIQDVMEDARRKAEVLARYFDDVAARGRQAIDDAAREQAEIDRLLAEGQQHIDKQIAQLQEELAGLRADGTARRLVVEKDLAASRNATAAESARVQAEVVRLSQIATFLGPMAPIPKPGSPQR